ncbi:MAG: hypothetical protein NC484_07755, partial [Alloprevotella sp.]|nr:hypothetical protein [Alloprevotella sp.]
LKVEKAEDGSQVVTLAFNATGKKNSDLTVALPHAEKGVVAEHYEIEYTDDLTEVAVAEIDAEKGTLNVTAHDNAAIGQSVTISVYKKAAQSEETEVAEEEPTVAPAALMSRADDGRTLVMTITVTINGLKIDVANKELKAGEAVEMTATVSPEAKVTYTCDGATVNGNKITFPAAGSYTVTATATKDGNELYTDTLELTVAAKPDDSGNQGGYVVVGIEQVNADAANGQVAVYDLSGRRLTRIARGGIYIVNGVKTLVR